MGRKPIGDEAKTDRPLRIRLTDDERASLDNAAGDKATATWARDVLLKASSRLFPKREKTGGVPKKSAG